MYELDSYDYDLHGDGTWETVSKNKKPKDKMKMDQKAAMKNPGAKGVKTTSDAAGTRRQKKQGNCNMLGKKPAPLMNWREAAKKKAETTEKQKRALLKNVQIGRSVKNPPQPANRKPVKPSAKNVRKGEIIKGKEAEKKKFDSFQAYNESFPDLPRSESTEEEVATAIPSHPVQDYSNLPPFYDLNGCDVSADVFRVLNAALIGGPGIQPLLHQPTLHELTEFIPSLQEYQVGDGLTDRSGLLGAALYGGCTGEIGISNVSLVSSEVNAGENLHEKTYEELFNIPVNKAQPSIVESQGTGVIHQEFKANNLSQDVNLHTRSDYQEKAIAEKNVSNEKKECTPADGARDSVPATGNENVPLTKVPMKRKKRVKVQTKDKDGGSVPHTTERQSNADIHAQEDYKVKINGSTKEAIPGKNQTDKDKLLEKLPTNVNKSPSIISDTASQVTTGVSESQEIENKNLPGLESASMDSLTSAVANLNISKTASSTAFKCDNQNNNCQEAANDDDESCLELNGLELKCIPDCFETISHIPNQTEQETERKADAIGQAKDSGMLREHGEEAHPGETPSLQETTENEETVETKKVPAELENDTADSEDKGMTVIETTEANGGGHAQQKQGNNYKDNENDAQEDALRMCQPFNDTCQNAGPEELQDKNNGNQKNPEEPVVETKVTYGDVIEYVMEQLKELYSGEDVDGFNPVIKIEHEPLPDELTRHLTLLRQLSYNYTPSFHPYDKERRRFSESSDSDWSDSFGDSYEDIEDKNDERSGLFNKDDEQMPLKRFHEKLQMFAQLNHLHQIVSNPRLGALLDDWKLRGSTEQLFHDGSDLFPNLIKGSKPKYESVLGNSACDVTEKGSPCDVIFPVEKGGERNPPILSFDYGQITETIENLLSSHDLQQSGMEPTEKEQIFQTAGPTESAPSHSVRLNQKEGLQGSQGKSEVRNGAEESWRSLISSPHRASDEGFQFFQHSFISSPENISDMGANDSRQDNSQHAKEHLATIRHFLWSQLTDVRASLDREIMGPRRQKEHKERAWQGGDIIETHRCEDGEATGVTTDQSNDVTNNVGTDITADIVTGVIADATKNFIIDDHDDLLGKGWMDRTLVDNLVNPKDEELIEKRNRREYRSKKFGVLPFWWMSR